MIGVLGIPLQFILYPRLNTRLGNIFCFRFFSVLFPLAYVIAPFLALIPQTSTTIIWFGIVLVTTIHTTGRIFVLPVTIVLLNNCAPDPSVLGMVHGAGQMTSALFRTLGPVCAGFGFGVSLEKGVVGGVWWVGALIAVLGWVTSLFLKETK